MSIVEKTNYYEKYLKYKSKYNELKNQKGGAITNTTYFLTHDQYIAFLDVKGEGGPKLTYNDRDKYIYCHSIRHYESMPAISNKAYEITDTLIGALISNDTLKIISWASPTFDWMKVCDDKTTPLRIKLDVQYNRDDGSSTRKAVAKINYARDEHFKASGNKLPPVEYVIQIFVSTLNGYNRIQRIWQVELLTKPDLAHEHGIDNVLVKSLHMEQINNTVFYQARKDLTTLGKYVASLDSDHIHSNNKTLWYGDFSDDAIEKVNQARAAEAARVAKAKK